MTGIGGKRNRGFGQVECTIDDTSFDLETVGGYIMEQVTITITVKSPTLIANSSTAGVLTSTRGSIDGRVLRGLFASQFISSHKLGREAHKNEIL